MDTVTVIEVEKPNNNTDVMQPFPDAAIGQLIHYGCHLLWVDSHRQFVIVILTDTYRIQFFKIPRAALFRAEAIEHTDVLPLRDVHENPPTTILMLAGKYRFHWPSSPVSCTVPQRC